jgi:hypothetical protein
VHPGAQDNVIPRIFSRNQICYRAPPAAR